MPSSETTTARGRRTPSAEEIQTAAPRVPWSVVYAHLRSSFEQGDHVSILGPTGTGKTHLALTVAELRSYVLVVATKPRDPLVTETLRRGYYHAEGPDLKRSIEYVDGRPLHPRVVYWPQLGQRQVARIPEAQRLRARRAYQRPLIAGALGYVDEKGAWCVVLDEGTWIYRDLQLGPEIDSALNQWRTMKASVVILGQRPAWMGRYVMSQPTHVFLFKTRNVEDAKSLGDITGVDTRIVRAIVQDLDFRSHEFLYYDARTQAMFRSIAPPR